MPGTRAAANAYDRGRSRRSRYFVDILANAKEGEEVELHKRVARVAEKAENAFVTAAEALHESGRLEGLQEGLEGQREMLLIQLTTQFGPPSARVRSRLHAASSAELLKWSKNFVTADTLDAVFGE